MITFKDIPWPPWVDMVTIISHLALTISCSLSFYIYYGKYGKPKQGMNRRVTKIWNLVKSSSQNSNKDTEAMALPDMDDFEENEILMETVMETTFDR